MAIEFDKLHEFKAQIDIDMGEKYISSMAMGSVKLILLF